MTARNISLTLEKAKEWYNSDSAELKEVALQAYTKEELKGEEWQNIKTFEDACKTLGIKGEFTHDTDAPLEITKHLVAIWKLDIIRKALNGKDWKPKIAKGDVCYPYVRIYPAGAEAKKAVRGMDWTTQETYIADGKKYTLVGGDYGCHHLDGLSIFGLGFVYPVLGLLGCKSKKIAQHMCKYFAKEIFEATYAQHTGAYKWCEG